MFEFLLPIIEFFRITPEHIKIIGDTQPVLAIAPLVVAAIIGGIASLLGSGMSLWGQKKQADQVEEMNQESQLQAALSRARGGSGRAYMQQVPQVDYGGALQNFGQQALNIGSAYQQDKDAQEQRARDAIAFQQQTQLNKEKLDWYRRRAGGTGTDTDPLMSPGGVSLWDPNR